MKTPLKGVFNGAFDTVDNIKISPFSRAYTFSDSVYEVVPFFNSTAIAFDDHIKRLEFSLTNDQIKTLEEINKDLCSSDKMFRLLQGDVGSGKTIVSLLAAYNTVNSGFQVALMAPTEILARQHYTLAKEIFPKNINIALDKYENNLFIDIETYLDKVQGANQANQTNTQ